MCAAQTEHEPIKSGARRAPGGLAPEEMNMSHKNIPPFRPPAPGAATAAQLERLSAAAVLGKEGLKRSSVVQITPPRGDNKDSGLPQISAPPEDIKDANPKGFKLVWQRLMEMTPGTNAHKREYGTRFAWGAYALTYGKRGNRPS